MHLQECIGICRNVYASAGFVYASAGFVYVSAGMYNNLQVSMGIYRYLLKVSMLCKDLDPSIEINQTSLDSLNRHFQYINTLWPML